MSDNQAIRPSSTLLSVDEVVEEEVADRKDTALGELQYHEGWLQVREMIEELIKSYRSGDFINAKGDEDFEQIGRKFLVSATVATELEGVLAQVDSAASIEKDGN